MRKEVIVAIVLGFTLGLVITFGIWSANNALTQQKKLARQETATPEMTTATPTATVNSSAFSLTIVKPENESISNTDKVTLSGTTSPNTKVAIMWETGEQILQADKNGDFDTDISLVNGINEIIVTAYSNLGEEINKTVNIVYTTEQI